MAPAYKLTYFNVKALAEPTRFLFSYGGIEFEDVRVEKEKWPEVKPTTPFGQMPLLEHNGKVVTQSIAIARYVAKQVKLAGNDDWENLEIDAIVDTINDFRGKLAAFHYEANEDVKQRVKETLFNETLPFYLGKFEAIAQKNDGHLAVGRLTWADFVFAGIIDYLNVMATQDITANSPNLKKVVENVNSIPSVKAWIDKRPVTEL